MYCGCAVEARELLGGRPHDSDRRSGARRTGRLLALRQLPHGGADLPAGQPATARAAPGRAHQTPTARALGNVPRAEPGVRPAQPADPPVGGGCGLHRRARSRRPGDRREHLPGGHLLRAVPGGHARRVRPGAPRAPVLDAGRHPEPRERHDAGLDPRGRRARVRARARVRRSIRPSRPPGRLRRGRRGGRDGTARRVVEGHPLPAPGARRRRAADPAPERLQDRGRDGARPAERRGGRRAPRAEGYEPQIVAGDDPHEVHRRFAEVLEGCYARIREIQADARAAGAPVLERPPAWPAIVLRTPKGWTGPDVVDGVQIAGDVPRPPGAALARAGGSRAPRAARDLAPQLCAGDATSTSAAGSCRSSRPSPRRATSAWARARTPTAAG